MENKIIKNFKKSLIKNIDLKNVMCEEQKEDFTNLYLYAKTTNKQRFRKICTISNRKELDQAIIEVNATNNQSSNPFYIEIKLIHKNQKPQTENLL